MGDWSINNERFIKTAIDIINRNGEVLVLVRYPYQAGNRDFFLIKSSIEFEEFIEKREPRESVMVFELIENVIEGTVAKALITSILDRVVKPKYSDWLVIFKELEGRTQHWDYCENKEELEDALISSLGCSFRVLEDPLWVDERLVYHAYVPDQNGGIYPGRY